MNNENWLFTATAAGKAELKAWMHKKDMEEQGMLSSASHGLEPDFADDIGNLPVWLRTATTAKAVHVSKTSAAILAKSPWSHASLPRVPNWEKILLVIGGSEFVRSFLRDIEFQHHQSTNGRMNVALGRWERYAVRPVKHWIRSGTDAAHMGITTPTVPQRTFHRIKQRLIDDGLIIAESHLWQGKTYLWIKPTDELSRMLFEPDYWDQVKHKFGPAKLAQKPASSGKPRGISARHQALDAELYVLYRQALKGSFVSLPPDDRWAIWDRLTKPTQMGKNYVKTPFAEKGSHRWKALYERLDLAIQ